MLEMEKVLVIAAHPDDEVLGVGGTIPLIKKRGGSVAVLVVTDGSSAQYAENPEAFSIKKAQMEEANQIMGTDDLVQWDLPDMRLDTLDHVDLTIKFANYIADGSFDTVFFHSYVDINLDHRVIHDAVSVATRPTPDQNVKNILNYYVNSSTEWGGRTSNTMFLPNYFIDISGSLEIKLSAMRAYQEELREYPHPRSIKAIEQRALVFGSDVGCCAAEPFHIILSRS